LKISDKCELIIPKLCDRHDYWMIESKCKIERFNLDVFNKWGELVFTADSLVVNGFALAHSRSNIINGKKHEYNLPDGKIVVVEAKGGSSKLGSRIVKNKEVRQAYRESIAT